MQKFSASYNNINPNFIISIDKRDDVEEPLSSLFSICRNILSRGVCLHIPDILSGSFKDLKVKNNICYTKCDILPKWSSTIKGGSSSNPARTFYEEDLNSRITDVLGEDHSFLTATFLPECPLEMISRDSSQRSSLDFYSPILGLAIEIDGQQHSLTEQRQKDAQRNWLLNNKNIGLVRLQTPKISCKDYSQLDDVLRSICSSKELVDFIDPSELQQSDIDCMYLIRLEHLLLTLLENGLIDLSDDEWEFNIICRENVRKDILDLAWLDVRTLLSHIASIMNVDIHCPEIINDKNGLRIDVSVLQYYDETSEECISIRNDYFPYDQDSDVPDRSPFFKNHYHVSNGDFRYNIDIEQIDDYGNKYQLKDNKQHLALLYVLKYCFGFNDFRNNQEEIIAHCLNEQSVIGVLPTSAGKSLCYQICSLLLPGSTLVISPLKSLMEDQYINLCAYGIFNVCFLNGDNKELKTDTVINNHSLITLISPERFFSSEFTSFISTTNSVRYRLIAVDEVHCISEWGHDFRTSYLCLSHSMKKYFRKNCSLIGLTATASPNVAEDIVAEFNSFKKNTLLITADSLNRPELKLHTLCFDNQVEKYRWLKDFVTQNTELKDKTVVFTKFVHAKDDSSCVPLSKKIREFTKTEDLDLIDFFCGSSNENIQDDRTNSEKLNNFKNGDTRLLFATKAFGMGVNIPDIRNTIHYGLSGSIESLYQEFGRAGRDGGDSDCYILFEKEYKGNIDRLSDNDLKIKDLASLKDRYSELKGNLFFIVNSNKDIEDETEYIWSLYRFLRDKSSFARDEFESSSNISVEKGLYRLLTLGIIDMWSITYTDDISNPTYSSIHVNELSMDDCITNLERYIGRYNYGYRYKGDRKFKSILRELLDWNFRNFVRNRIESLRLLYEYCRDNQTSEELMNSITSFLTADPGLKGIVKNEDPKAWFDYIERTSPENRKHKTDRYLESYHNDKALDFISALSAFELSKDIANDENTVKKMDSALIEVSSYSIEDKKKIVTGVFTTLTDKEKVDTMVMLFLERLPECTRMIYELTENELSERFILSEYNDELKKIGEMLDDKTR